ncbi:MAG: HlyD family secretion protein [Gammaproteobacteria bacterium]
MKRRILPVLILTAALTVLMLSGCSRTNPLPLVGTLERDRMDLVAEAQEPIVRIDVQEGDQVHAGQAILQLDDRRQRTLLAEARAVRDQAEARLAAAQAMLTQARKDFTRTAVLVRRRVRSEAELDRVRATFDSRRADVAAAEATRAEAQAAVAGAELTLHRLTVHAPRAATVDALPFHLGERPPVHAVVAVLLDAESAYARVYVPEPLRARMRPGMPAVIRIDGSARSYRGTLRFISADAAFTPYYALTERDRSRLAYLAKVYFIGVDAANLPTGAPVSVDFPSLHR